MPEGFESSTVVQITKPTARLPIALLLYQYRPESPNSVGSWCLGTDGYATTFITEVKLGFAAILGLALVMH